MDLLLEVFALAKKYMCDAVSSFLMQTLKRRLQALNQTDAASAETLERLMASAIANDIGPLRMAALEKAKELPALREKYNKRELAPEILFELEAIWPTPSSTPPAKRLKLVV